MSTPDTEKSPDTGPGDGATGNAISVGVFIPALLLVAAVLIWGLGFTNSFEVAADAAFGWTANSLGWLFVLAATGFVGFVLWLAFSKYGNVRLGGDHETPTFRTASWISMMFAAGMGIGLMFYGVSEPLTHYRETPPGSPPGVTTAMSTTTFHWTIHAWSIYAVVGLALALTAYRFGGKHLISSAFVPLLGEVRANGWLGKALDVLAIFATVFGTAASLGVGALQIQSGLQETGAVSGQSIAVVVGVIVVLGLCFVLSAVSGIERGIQILSNINMVLAALLALFVLVFSGAAVFMLDLIPTSLSSYVDRFFAMAARTGASADHSAGDWLSDWTVFYWAWWISWSPFVGMFLARISRGRTIREFVVGVIIVPSALSIIWFAIFGGAALDLELKGRSIWGDGDQTAQLFNLFRELPLTGLLAVVAMFLVGIFFITGADAASIIMAGMSQYGAENPKKWMVVLWGALTAGVAVLMLIPGMRQGDPALALDSLQSLTIIAASPFVIVLTALCFSMIKALANDPFITERKYMLPKSEQKRLAEAEATGEARGVPGGGGGESTSDDEVTTT